ncbi:MAG: hypothetical protein F4X27_02400, partial [Chloroflexi bacterium]|nr:hypothetical protein [Chloroflexota bacterium]
MDTYVTFELAYRVTKLIDLNTPHQEIAAKTGLDEDHVRQVEEWAKRVPDIPSSEDHDTFTATQILVLQYLGRTRLSRNEKAKIRRSGSQGITADRAR